jgi:diguanylate cyclase (GGDEF)-like protein
MDFEAFSILLSPVIVVDFNGNIVYSNEACKTTFGLGPNQMAKRIFPKFLNPQVEISFDLSSLKEPTRYTDVEFDTGRAKGSILYALQPIKASDGTPYVMVAFFDDALERGLLKKYRDEKENSGELYKTSITDELTQMNNVRYFKTRLEEEVTKTLGGSGQFSLAIFDIDRFKSVNDTYGHLVGDQAIKVVATQMKASVRPTDLIARYGGEEFVALFVGAGAKEALLAAERIRANISNSTIDTEKGPLRLTCSAGISVFPLDATDSVSLLEKADLALYKAKNTGRDRAIVFNSMPSAEG